VGEPTRWVRIVAHGGHLVTQANVGDAEAMLMIEVAKRGVVDRILNPPAKQEPITDDKPSTTSQSALGLARTVA